MSQLLFKSTAERIRGPHRNSRSISNSKSAWNAQPAKAAKNDRIGHFADLVAANLGPSPSLKDILKGVWANEVITSQCPNLVIRLTSLRGQVSKRLWEMKGNNPAEIQILAVGTTDIPQHLTGYHKFLDGFYKKAEQYAADYRSKDHKYEIGYDLLSKGSDEARASVMKLFNRHYGFGKEELDKCTVNSAIISGGMRGLKDLADGLILHAKENGHAHRFIQPDNSFGTWWNIIEKPEKGDSFRREILTVEAKPQNKLHLTADDVVKYYNDKGVTPHESWYITPVGNPSGTKMLPEQIVSACDAIVSRNPKAVIILDSVYIRTCAEEDGLKLMKGVVNNSKLLNNIVFLESFSKSHGLCRERIGMYFSTNEQLFTRMHSANIAFSAGPGIQKDFQFLALGNLSPQEQEGVSDLHRFWTKERKGLYNFLMGPKHKHLFEENQAHVRVQEDLDRPCTLYILLKTKPGIKAQDVFIDTGVLGVDTPLLSGHYVRFSVGTLTQPTFERYL